MDPDLKKLSGSRWEENGVNDTGTFIYGQSPTIRHIESEIV